MAQVGKSAPRAQPSKSRFKGLIISTLSFVFVLTRDIWAVVMEILAFSRKSSEVCEARSKPWRQALVVFCFTAAASAAGSVAAASRPAVAGLEGSYWLTRVCSTRLLAFVYIWAFAAALFQNKALIGDRGILPARYLLQRAEAAASCASASWWEKSAAAAVAAGSPAYLPKRKGWLLLLMKLERLPTLLWFAKDTEKLDPWLDAMAVMGLFLSVLAFVGGGASALHFLALWALYHSINAVGQRWYSFGWESQILETTLLALLAAPWASLSCSGLPAVGPPSALSVWAFRWLSFRIILGAGLIKVRGSRCWLDLTAMCHHIETQPIPNPLSRYLHNLPRGAMLFSTASNHFIELVAPWLLLVPWLPCQAAYGWIHIAFQSTLILSGNLSFLNWLTIVPGLWCLDDAVLAGMLPGSCAQWLADSVRAASASSASNASHALLIVGGLRDLAAFMVLGWLSIPVYQNLLGPHAGGRQVMNSAFDRKIAIPSTLARRLFTAAPKSAVAGPLAAVSVAPERAPELTFNLRALRLLNSYGAFGSVNQERVEIVFEGIRDDGEWKPYTFKAAVDDSWKRPGWVSPYHFRLDWCRWIASCRGRRAIGMGLQETWVLSFAAQLLMGNVGVCSLLARRPSGDPFDGGPPPKRIRAELYVYRFAPPPKASSDPYWWREYVGQYLPPMDLAALSARLDTLGLPLMPPKI